MSFNPLSFPSLPSQRSSRAAVYPPTSPTHSELHVSPSSSTAPSTVSDEDEDEDDLAEQEWQESLKQLALLFNLVLLPFAGKYFGRKFAYFSMYSLLPCCPVALSFSFV
jgi:hypothetical protein